MLVYYPKMIVDMSTFISRCETGRKAAYRQPNVPMALSLVTEYPWDRVGVVVFQDCGNHYWVVYGVYSSFANVDHIREDTANVVIETFSLEFPRYGYDLKPVRTEGPSFQ